MFALLLATMVAPTPPVPSPAPLPWEFDRVEGTTVFFKANKPMRTTLHDLRYLGELRPPQGTPYLLFTARPCQDCLQDKAIYVLRPEGGRPTHFVYPGRVLDPRTRQVLLESRSFFGRCLSSSPSEVFVTFQKERVDRRRSLQQSVFIAEAGRDHLEERLLERRLPSLDRTLRAVRAKQCREIEGRNRLMLSKPLDLTPRRGDDEERDGDDQTKESQTQEELPSPQE
jgi:hypothetical protein